MSDFRERIFERYDQLTAGFRKLADFLLNNTIEAAFLTVAGVSRRTGVDPATVVRFAQEFGYSGYRQLSLEIKDYVRRRVEATYTLPEDGSDEAVMGVLFQATRYNLEQFAATEMAQMVAAVDAFVQAKRVWATGEGVGYAPSSFLAEAFASVGVPGKAFRPTLAEAADALSRMEAGDILVSVVLKTPSLDTGYVVKEAKAKGVKTVVVADLATPLAVREADIPLIVPSRSPSATSSFSAVMAVLMLLWEGYLAKRPKAMAERTSALYDMLEQMVQLRKESKPYDR